jgi:pimeloyl-[acyl-carrier protein] methyl ester esterase
MSGLAITSTGQGPDLVLLHGWGMHSGIWSGMLAGLEQDYRVHCVDLPGHGHSPRYDRGFALPELAAMVMEVLASRLAGATACWAGWSLGGMLALQIAADFPARVGRLVMLAAAPRFSQAPDWPAGMAPEVLQEFGRELKDAPASVQQRFLSLQVLGTPEARQTLRQLRERVAAAPGPDPAALAAGMDILARADLRTVAAGLARPVLLIGGSRDRLLKPAALQDALGCFPRARLEIIEQAGHAPFVSHPDQVQALVQEFCHDRH